MSTTSQENLVKRLTRERLESYLEASDGDIAAAISPLRLERFSRIVATSRSRTARGPVPQRRGPSAPRLRHLGRLAGAVVPPSGTLPGEEPSPRMARHQRSEATRGRQAAPEPELQRQGSHRTELRILATPLHRSLSLPVKLVNPTRQRNPRSARPTQQRAAQRSARPRAQLDRDGGPDLTVQRRSGASWSGPPVPEVKSPERLADAVRRVGQPLGGGSTPSPHTIRPAAEPVEASSPLLWRTSKGRAIRVDRI